MIGEIEIRLSSDNNFHFPVLIEYSNEKREIYGGEHYV